MSYGKISIIKNHRNVNFVSLGFALDYWDKKIEETFILKEKEYIIKSKNFNSDINVFNTIFFYKEKDCKDFCLDLIPNYFFKK